MTTKVIHHNNNCNEREGIDSLTVGDGDARLIPALGESWAHSTTTRLLLACCDDEQPTTGVYGRCDGESGVKEIRRVCRLVKSPHKAAGIAYFSITEFGVRDCCWNPPMEENGARVVIAKGGGNDKYRSRKKIHTTTNR